MIQGIEAAFQQLVEKVMFPKEMTSHQAGKKNCGYSKFNIHL